MDRRVWSIISAEVLNIKKIPFPFPLLPAPSLPLLPTPPLPFSIFPEIRIAVGNPCVASVSFSCHLIKLAFGLVLPSLNLFFSPPLSSPPPPLSPLASQEHSYHLLLLLPTILLSNSPLSALAYCPEAYPPETCSHLHTTFETALLASRQNLYNLKEEFYPSSHKSPVYGQVSFALKIKPDVSKSMCPSDNKEEKQATPEELSSSYMFIWTSSGLLGRIDPMTLSFYQPEILSKIYSSVGILDYSFDFQKPQPSFIELELKLDVENNLTCTPSVRQLTTSLADMTSWVSSNESSIS